MGTTPQSHGNVLVHGVSDGLVEDGLDDLRRQRKEEDSVCSRELRLEQYWDGDACQSCPANSVGAGGTATTCTCAANYWAQKSGSTWTCKLMLRSENQGCDLDGSRPAHARMRTPSVLTRLRATTNHYLSGGECVACPDDSTSTEAASTACRCPDNEYAEWSNSGGGSWSCESCPDGTVKSGGSVIPQASEASDSCNANCASGKYWDGARARTARQLCRCRRGGDDVHVRRELLGQEVRQHLVVRAMLRSKNQGRDLDGSRFRLQRG